MINADDLKQMKTDLAAVRGDNEASIVFRRGGTTLAAQSFRVARTGSGGRHDSNTANESRTSVVLLGATAANVQVDDRFTLNGVLYRVTFVRPNRTAATMAEAEAVE